MSRKFRMLYLIIFLSTLIGGVYGILHDQITFTISNEYYTKLKFYQFGLEYFIANSPRVGVAIVGFLATWYLGLAAGIILGLIFFLFPSPKLMLSVTLKALGIALAIAFFTPIIGVPAYFLEDYLDSTSMESYSFVDTGFVPADVKITEGFSYILVGFVHGFSYLGGLLGVLAGIMFQIWTYRKHVRLVPV
ncbi:hypothetical protein GU926_05760 [Nibribacter ruber]|uniref:Signal peptide-containing protein n=1 Tax=Nibribacter ruber TaxID=2698458 RepID=A0A6P1NYD6_9BACT|nr:hypothetical protein [Nibribacter ruber]QHL86968.1 hypothetical protein GU926_05760 [Nibribacter ruber]